MLDGASVASFEKDEVLFRENDEPDYLYLVLEGEVALMREGSRERPLDIAMMGPGDYFGELGLLDGSPRSTGARIVKPAKLALVDSPSLADALSGAPAETFFALVSRIGASLRKTNDLLLAENLRKEKMILVGEMANTIVHDLRSPFTILNIACDGIRQRSEDPRIEWFCDSIEKQVSRMTTMVSEILEFSKGTTQLRRERVTVARLFETFEAYNRPELERKPLELVIEAVDAEVLCDEEKILRVLQNLFNNAADAIGEKEGRIALSSKLEGDRVVLSLADDGPGIPEDVRATVFEPFVTKEKTKGTGLGLAIARSVVAAHGGEISFETETGKGTTFRVSLPGGMGEVKR